MLLAAMAGGMAWGIRGQYGHETGAMIAGVLIGFTILVLHGRHLSSLASARAVALFALGISIGGCMTYGQTVGLTHDAPLVGNVAAYRWGMLGLAIKGGVWIAFGAAMLGMGLSGKQYRPLELLILFVAMIGAMLLGMYLLNSPFDPEQKLLPKLYFSDHWFWEPDVDKPRREKWGGLLLAFVLLMIYLGAVKKEWLGFSLGMWGLLGGALGFPVGQSVQAFNAWNSEWVRALPTSGITNYFNWWNMMETTFGFVMGATVGLGCWVHRKWIGWYADIDEEAETVRLLPLVEFMLLAVHVRLLVAWNFQSLDIVDVFADLAIPMVVIPSIAVMSGRIWPFLMALPVVMLPIAGKSVRHVLHDEKLAPAIENWSWFQSSFGEQPVGQSSWDLYLIFPLLIATIVALCYAIRSSKQPTSRSLHCVGLLITTWLYFVLNNGFFQSPWPWREWTGRTANGTMFFLFALGLTFAAIAEWIRRSAIGNLDE